MENAGHACSVTIVRGPSSYVRILSHKIPKSCDNGRMRLRRIILLVLLLPAAAVSAWYFLQPGPGHELLCYIFVVPVLVLNMWEWTSPELLDAVLGKKQGSGDSEAGIKAEGNTVDQPPLPLTIPEVSSEPQVQRADFGDRAGEQDKSTPTPASGVQNRALSLRQPHAENILRGVKTNEYRTIPTNIRGRVYIYASKQPADPGTFEELGAKPGDFPTGLLVGTVEIVGCEKADSSEGFQWQLANPERLAEPLKPENKPQPVWFTPFHINPQGKQNGS